MRVTCRICGRVFKYAAKGVARRLRTLHEKTAHPDTVEAY